MPGKNICQISDCNNYVTGYGYCRLHYQKLKLSNSLPKKIVAVCSVEDCQTHVYAKSLCHRHYERLRRHSRTETVLKTHCDQEECEGKHYGRGLCRKHYVIQYNLKKKSDGKYLCTIEGCKNTRHTKYLCQLHHRRIKDFGDSSENGKPTLDNRFWAQVDKECKNGCWEWQGLKNEQGYGRISFKGRAKKAHRVMWFLVYREFPKMNLLHSCDNPSCVNPAHLREGTQKENSADMMRRRRHHTQRTVGRMTLLYTHSDDKIKRKAVENLSESLNEK